MSAYNTALAKIAAALSVKMGALALLTVRSRVITGNFGRTAAGGKPWYEDTVISPYIAPLFTIMLGAVGPTFSTEKFCGLVSNANENEPYFLALAGAVGLAGPPAIGVSCLYTYCAARFAHAGIYLVDFPEILAPYKSLCRATAWLTSQAAMYSLAFSVLLK